MGGRRVLFAITPLISFCFPSMISLMNKSITEQDAKALFAPSSGQTIAVAVSGGVDSMSLAFCLKRSGYDMHAFIVEHGLREESADEAKMVAGWLANLDISSTILPWKHDGITSRIHVEARKARYQLLLEACKSRGIKTLCLGHHQDDQAETILMRFAKGSGIDGLAGMDQVSEQGGVQISRPFLNIPKAQLIATCDENHIQFVTDPSNEKECYARGRLRRTSKLLEAEGFTPARLADLGDRAREARDALQFYTDNLCQNAIKLLKNGVLELNLDVYSRAPFAVRLRVLGACFMYLNPKTYAPERKQLLPFTGWVDSDDNAGRTFHGASISKRKGTLVFMRELAGITEERTSSGLWDHRWEVSGLDASSGHVVRALGVQKHKVLDAASPGLRKKVPSGRPRAVLPALWDGDKLLAVLGFPSDTQTSVTASLKPPFWVKPL